MSDLDPIVNLTISADGSPLSKAGFGTLAIVCAQAASSMTIDTFTSISAVGTAYTVNSPRYRAALAAFSVNPRPTRIKFINTTLAAAQSVQVTVQAAASGTVTSMVLYNPDGTTTNVSYTAGGAETTSTVATAFAAALSAASPTNFSATAAAAVVTIVARTAGHTGFFQPTANLGSYLDNTADPGFAAQLTAALALDSDWYGICSDQFSQACGLAVAAWAEANGKIHVAGNCDARELLTGGPYGVAAVAAGYRRTAGIWFSRPWEFDNIAWMAARLIDPEAGRKTWAFAELASRTVDTLNTTQRGFLAANRWNYFVSVAGKNVVVGNATSLPGGGYTFSGAWIDEVQGDDWLIQRSQEDIAGLLMNAGIVLYDQAGINAVGDTLLKRLRYAERLGLLTADSSVVNIPQLANVLSADRSGRVLNNLTASAKRAGAIHQVANINIALSY